MLRPAALPLRRCEREASIDQREDDITDAERPDEARRDADELDADLLEPPGAGRELVLVAEQADGEVPHTPAPRWTGTASIASSIRSRSSASLTPSMTAAATIPMIAAFHGLMTCADADRDEPGERGVHDRDDVRRPSRNQVSAIPARPPKAAATVVFRITRGTSGVSP